MYRDREVKKGREKKRRVYCTMALPKRKRESENYMQN